jgi:hypothetical protein
MIVFIWTESGKWMPCEVSPVMYRADPGGGMLVYNRQGKQVRCTLDCTREDFTGLGYVPHWAGCVSGEGRRRLDGYRAQAERERAAAVKPKAEPAAVKAAEPGPEFEQLSLFPAERRRWWGS